MFNDYNRIADAERSRNRANTQQKRIKIKKKKKMNFCCDGVSSTNVHHKSPQFLTET